MLFVFEKMKINEKEAEVGPFFKKRNILKMKRGRFRSSTYAMQSVVSMTRLGDLLDFGQLFKAFGNN